MSFFPHLHDPERGALLDEDVDNPAFERFYEQHIKKLLLARGGQRYLSKGNYNVTRLGYLKKIFPDARFVICVRHPIDHVASSLKQHRLFSAALNGHARARAHLERVGHFEFGPLRRPIHTGDPAALSQVLAAWQAGDEVAGWARYWALIYDFLRRELARTDHYQKRALVVRYEDLCTNGGQALASVLSHCDLRDEGLSRSWGPRLTRPTYYRHGFSAQEQAAITAHTRDVASWFGYGEAAEPEANPSSRAS
jgi:hypothetical protein